MSPSRPSGRDRTATDGSTGRATRPRPKMHLAQFLVHGPTYHSLAMWRHPKTAAASAERGFAWDRPELYQHIARTCERGLFDTVFFADSQLHR